MQSYLRIIKIWRSTQESDILPHLRDELDPKDHHILDSPLAPPDIHTLWLKQPALLHMLAMAAQIFWQWTQQTYPSTSKHIQGPYSPRIHSPTSPAPCAYINFSCPKISKDETKNTPRPRRSPPVPSWNLDPPPPAHSQPTPNQWTWRHVPPSNSRGKSLKDMEWWMNRLLESHMSDGLNLLHPRKDMAEMVIVFCVCPPSFLRVWCCGHEMSKWLKRRSSKSRSSRTSSNKRKSSSSHEKGMVSYQQGSRFRALSLWGCVCKDWETTWTPNPLRISTYKKNKYLYSQNWEIYVHERKKS